MRSRFVLLMVLALMAPAATFAGNNLTLQGGALFPVSDFANTADISPYGGLRFEWQDVNALGQTAVQSFLIYGGYAVVFPTPEYETLLEQTQGSSEDGSYFEVGLATRVYSKKNSAFVGVGAAYVNLNEAGPPEAKPGLGLMLGLGIANNSDSYRLELEGRVNFGIMKHSTNIVSFLVLLGIGLPF